MPNVLPVDWHCIHATNSRSRSDGVRFGSAVLCVCRLLSPIVCFLYAYDVSHFYQWNLTCNKIWKSTMLLEPPTMNSVFFFSAKNKQVREKRPLSSSRSSLLNWAHSPSTTRRFIHRPTQRHQQSRQTQPKKPKYLLVYSPGSTKCTVLPLFEQYKQQ